MKQAYMITVTDPFGSAKMYLIRRASLLDIVWSPRPEEAQFWSNSKEPTEMMDDLFKTWKEHYDRLSVNMSHTRDNYVTECIWVKHGEIYTRQKRIIKTYGSLGWIA